MKELSWFKELMVHKAVVVTVGVTPLIRTELV